MDSSPFHMDQNFFGEVNAINTDQNMGSLSTKLFEKKLEDINQDLRRFDAVTKFHSESKSPMGKENNLESITINEIFLKSTQSRATSHGCVYHYLFYLILQTLTQGFKLLGNVRLGPSQAQMSSQQMQWVQKGVLILQGVSWSYRKRRRLFLELAKVIM